LIEGEEDKKGGEEVTVVAIVEVDVICLKRRKVQYLMR